uniref:Pollen Ole e 1 allergen and extensin family protein n=1 Tax=Lotus japonicus TaxID=34305 RepID=I3SB93_LOTJA|nr:unknown [Lotus japonicus]
MVKGNVSCTDCTDNYDFSGIKVSVKCEGVQNKALTTTTEEDGSFKVHLPSHYAKSPSMKCLAKLLGGPDLLYASRKNRVSLIVKAKEENIYTISTPLSFFTYCPQNSECKAANEFGSSKTFDFPMPPAWGLAPSSYYFPLPFFPIIGIP